MRNSLFWVQKSNRHITSGCRAYLLPLKIRLAVQFLVTKNLAVNHLPLEAPLAVQRVKNCKLQTRPQDRGHVTSLGLPLTMKNRMLKVSNTDAIRWSHSLGQREKARFLESPMIFFVPSRTLKLIM